MGTERAGRRDLEARAVRRVNRLATTFETSKDAYNRTLRRYRRGRALASDLLLAELVMIRAAVRLSNVIARRDQEREGRRR